MIQELSQGHPASDLQSQGGSRCLGDARVPPPQLPPTASLLRAGAVLTAGLPGTARSFWSLEESKQQREKLWKRVKADEAWTAARAIPAGPGSAGEGGGAHPGRWPSPRVLDFGLSRDLGHSVLKPRVSWDELVTSLCQNLPGFDAVIFSTTGYGMSWAVESALCVSAGHHWSQALG